MFSNIISSFDINKLFRCVINQNLLKSKYHGMLISILIVWLPLFDCDARKVNESRINL